MKIYIPEENINPIPRLTTPLQRAFSEGIYSNNQSISNELIFEIETDINKADLCLLPYMWNYYVENNKFDDAQKSYKEARKRHLKLLIFSTGDFTANIPFKNSIIVQSSCFKSRDLQNQTKILAIPTFIDDFTQLYCNGNVMPKDKDSIPVVGFCGQANGTLIDYSRRLINFALKKISYRIGIRRWEPPNIEPTLFRRSVLKRISESGNVRSNFLMRTRYRAGYTPTVKDPYHPTRLEFVHNILDSDYTICMRGGGNFSVRFYETLSLGRIPIFINTDCVLPLDEIIDYKKYLIWVDQSELSLMPQKIVDFHNSLDQANFKQLQVNCNELWRNYLTFPGFFSHFPQTISRYLNE